MRQEQISYGRNDGSLLRAACVLLCLAFTLVVSYGWADTIVLKNGRRIPAGAVTEDGDKVFYEGAEGQIALPKSLIDRIEKDNAEPAPSSPPSPAPPSGSPSGVIAKALSVQIQVPQKDAEGVIREGAVDEERLQAITLLAGKGDLERQNAVNAYLVAAAFEIQHQRAGPAGKFSEAALDLSPEDLNALILAADIDLQRQQYSESLRHLLLAQSLKGDSPEVLTLLGYAYYFLDGPEKANRYWKQAKALRPDPRLDDLIAQTDKEEKVEGGFVQAQSSHFILYREGSEISESFSREILETLEQEFRDLESALDYSPREPLTVILYPAKQFADITRVPGWVGALNDGKIRVPVRGLSSMTAELARVLKHEMVHSFVHRQVQGRCPTWFNEGLAQVESGEAPALPSFTLATIYADSRQIPLAQLEGSFMQFNTATAALAYAESQAGVNMIADRYGPYELSRLLKAMGEGKSMAEALRQLFRTDYKELDTDMASRLAKR
jgi:tetratricopeptide (TPR) repeat protein